MSEILGNDASRIVKCMLSLRKADSVLSLIRQILNWIPLETDLRHRRSLYSVWVFCHTLVWRDIASLSRRQAMLVISSGSTDPHALVMFLVDADSPFSSPAAFL
jgi:hypothetical protein